MTNVRSRTIMALNFELSVICRAQYQEYTGHSNDNHLKR